VTLEAKRKLAVTVLMTRCSVYQACWIRAA